jgi:hypothetical protein
LVFCEEVVARTQQQKFIHLGIYNRRGDSLRYRVIHRFSRREDKRWKWLLKAMSVVEEKATRRRERMRWTKISMT